MSTYGRQSLNMNACPQIFKQRLRKEIIPNKTSKLKADGVTRRLVAKNDGSKVSSIKTGVLTSNPKSIAYEMVQYAFD